MSLQGIKCLKGRKEMAWGWAFLAYLSLYFIVSEEERRRGTFIPSYVASGAMERSEKIFLERREKWSPLLKFRSLP